MSLDQDIANLVAATNSLTNTVDSKIAEIDNHVNTAIDNVVNAKSVTYYVDALNGDDNNDGSSGSPFQTIGKACDSVPIGGNGTIHLAQNQTHYISSDILLVNKSIVIQGSNAVIENVPFKYTANGVDYTTTPGFNLSFSEIHFLYVTIRTANCLIDSNGSVLPLVSFWDGFIKRYDMGHGFVQTIHSIIEIGDSSFICKSNVGLPMDLHMYGGVVNRVGQNRNGFLVNIESGDFRFSVSSVSLGTENDGSTYLTWDSLVTGVVKDSNGVPRNVISNIIF